MEDQDFRSPKKKRCARKLESRFPTMSEEEIAEISKVFVPSNTAKNTQWAVSCFTEWRSARNSARGAKRLCPVDLLENPVVTGNMAHITCYFSHPQSLLPATFHTCLCYSTNTPQQFSIVVSTIHNTPLLPHARDAASLCIVRYVFKVSLGARSTVFSYLESAAQY